MSGEYDSYGRVFSNEKINENLRDSIQWDLDWGDVCDLMFNDNKSNGIAAVHTKCFKGEIPKTRSENDPNQGWGNQGNLMGNVDENIDLDNYDDEEEEEDFIPEEEN